MNSKQILKKKGRKGKKNKERKIKQRKKQKEKGDIKKKKNQHWNGK